MTTGSPAKHILNFAVPLILTNVGQQFYMIADSTIVGRGVGVRAFAAVGATDWCYWLILWTVGGLTQGFSTFVAWAFGEKNYQEMSRFVAMSFGISACTFLAQNYGEGLYDRFKQGVAEFAARHRGRMRTMNWMLLGIEPTKDKKAITAVYRVQLAHTNPEDKPDSFTLR